MSTSSFGRATLRLLQDLGLLFVEGIVGFETIGVIDINYDVDFLVYYLELKG